MESMPGRGYREERDLDSTKLFQRSCRSSLNRPGIRSTLYMLILQVFLILIFDR